MDKRLLRTAVDGFDARLRGAGPGSWSAPTPCGEWDLRALVNHVVGELRWVPPLLAGRTISEVGNRFDGDLLGDDRAAAHRAAADEAVAATDEPDVESRTVHLSFGDLPGSEYLGQVISDVTIHTWDLARATGGDERLDGELVDAVHAFMAPQVDQWRSAGAFGPAVDAGESAGAQETLLAVTGRDPRP